jgi:hypothetical protein
MKGSEDRELYHVPNNQKESCSSKYEEVKVEDLNSRGVEAKSKPQSRIHRKCEREFVPLHKRTNTLDNLKKHDSIANRETAEYYSKRYENLNRVQLYENRRKRIMDQRISNNDNIIDVIDNFIE